MFVFCTYFVLNLRVVFYCFLMRFENADLSSGENTAGYSGIGDTDQKGSFVCEALEALFFIPHFDDTGGAGFVPYIERGREREVQK